MVKESGRITFLRNISTYVKHNCTSTPRRQYWQTDKLSVEHADTRLYVHTSKPYIQPVVVLISHFSLSVESLTMNLTTIELYCGRKWADFKLLYVPPFLLIFHCFCDVQSDHAVIKPLFKEPSSSTLCSMSASTDHIVFYGTSPPSMEEARWLVGCVTSAATRSMISYSVLFPGRWRK
jgi:hypothetical protein